MQNQGKGDQGNQGRTYDQKTHDGTSSAATMGTGGTGRTGTDEGYDEAAHRPWEGTQQSGRTDDLLSDGSDADQDGQGFARDPGNRQQDRNEDREQSLSGGGRPSDPTGLQNSAGNEQSGGDAPQR
ncbi:hypothetical protein [Massilia sp. METH4]|uniref:hypothetical protein n=1 Tax=Massilia sp. METH4 TaxID=3123041 RepID=UPI0030CBE7D6